MTKIKKTQALEKLTIEMWPQKMVGWIVKASKECGQFHVFDFF